MGWNSFYSLKGRAPRTEYWLVALATLLIAIAYFSVAEFGLAIPVFTKDVTEFNMIDALVYFGASIVLVFVMIPIMLRRLHDRGKGWVWLAFYSANSLLIDTVEIMSLPFLNLPNPDQAGLNMVYIIFGVISLVSFIDLGCLRGTRGTNEYGTDPLLGAVDDPKVFD